MFVRSAQCGACDSRLQVGPKLFSLKLAPRRLECGHCGELLKTSFLYRTTWTSWLTWKVFSLLLAAGFVVLVIGKSYPPVETVMIALIGALLLAIPVSYILSLIVPFPLQALLELIHRLPRSRKKCESRESDGSLTRMKEHIRFSSI